jgi:ABC-type Na+ efflux pump permease subunit
MRRIALIARREVVAYASVPSFWAALLMGPLLMALAALGAGQLGAVPARPSVTPLAVVAADPALANAAIQALNAAAGLEHRALAVRRTAEPGDAKTTLRLAATPAGGVELQVEGERLSDLTLALLLRDLATAHADLTRVTIAQPPPPPAAADDAGRFTRFSTTLLLWLVLVGSLGMLLQAIVRERSNRTLESLLAAVRPSEIVLGKLAGIGALSTLVIAVWLAGGALVAASPLGRATPGADLLLRGFGDPAGLVVAGGLFVLAFVMYGSAMIALGALARDVPAAQNLSRPVFGVLLAAFFIAVGQLVGMGGGGLPTLAMFPPFAPFVLILARPGSIGALHATVAVAGMAASTLACMWLAALALKGEAPRLFARRAALQAATAGAAPRGTGSGRR